MSRSNKSIQVTFDSEKAAQHFADCKISLNGNNFAFRGNPQRLLKVSIHDVHPNISDASLEYELSHYFGAILDIKRHTKQYKNKVHETGTRTFFITELYKHIPRSCRIFNRWCLLSYAGHPYSVRKKQTNIRGKSDKDDEESMSTSKARTNSRKNNSDEESSTTFETVEEKDTSFSSKRNLDRS